MTGRFAIDHANDFKPVDMEAQPEVGAPDEVQLTLTVDGKERQIVMDSETLQSLEDDRISTGG
jgi:hypothetical protein